MSKIEPIYLFQQDLVNWEGHVKQRKDCIVMPLSDFDGETNLTSFEGLEVLNENVGSYVVHASSMLFVANVSPLGKFRFREGEKPSNPILESMLFCGSIAIYSKGNVRGTDLVGYDIEAQGRIWTAKNPVERFSHYGLRKLILGDSTKDSEKVQRIEGIIKGYEEQEFSRQQAQSSAIHESYLSGIHEGTGSSRF